MKIAANIVGGLLGFIFVAISLMILLGLGPKPPQPPPGSDQAMFMGAFFHSGWITLVKVCELIGGILVAIPKTRNFGLLILGPIVINILAFHILIMKGEGLFGPPLIVAVFALFLLFCERKAFLGLLR